MIYNNYTAKPLWKDLKIYESANRNKRRYVCAPNPGRDHEKSVPLYKFLLKTSQIRDVRVIKDLIYQGKIRVNNVVVKNLKHPLHFYDYLTQEDITYLVVFQREHKEHVFQKIGYMHEEYVLPVSRWFLKNGLCMVNTYQNKLFSFTPSSQLYDKLRKLDSVIYYNPKTLESRVSTISEKQQFNLLIKLTGKQVYQKFMIIEHSEYDKKVNLSLKKENSETSCTVILPKSMFRKRYLPNIL